jgi:hypothetical protein
MQNAEKLLPNHYLGIYRGDEPSGNQVDGGYDLLTIISRAIIAVTLSLVKHTVAIIIQLAN